MSTDCPSCCPDCLITKPASHFFDSPYALPKLLQAGTVILKVSPDIRHSICNHNHAEDGWHDFDVSGITSRLNDSQCTIFCRELDFLVKQSFISVTFRCSDDEQIILRIYLIPYDLPNVQGKLRVRKTNVLNPAKRYLRALLTRIIQDYDGWLGLPSTGDAKGLIPERIDSRTLSEIYADLCSPVVTPAPGLGNIANRLLDFDDDLEGLGMQSKLYRYQRRSVAAMLQKELDTQDVPDPLYIPVRALDGRVFYLQPGTSEILLECPMTAPCRGGILCEELGTGKTVMMIGLIMATRNQISLPEQSIIDERMVLTPLAFRCFPSGDFALARKRFHRGQASLSCQQSETRVPSLVELLLHHYRVSPHCNIPDGNQLTRMIERQDRIQNLPLGEALRANTPFYHHFLGEPHNLERTKRSDVALGPRVMYLTSATLIIVPPNLPSQWDREITKHCAIPLRVLILRSKTPLPSVRSLATDFDIILMTYTQFTGQYDTQDVSKLHTWNQCKCPELSGYRVPDCNCQVAGVSPLLQIRWKRLVIDEGHVSATLSTTLITFAKQLCVERRWIVTGTPTTNLLGLGLGNKVTESLESSSQRDNLSALEEVEEGVDWSEDTPLFSPQGTDPPPSTPVKRIWNKYDRGDLNKLGSMIAHFIAVPQFTADSSLITTHVTEALLDPSGPRHGSIQVLSQVMQLVMIRHRIEDVEMDVTLPRVTHESVLLDLDPHVIKSFNSLQAAIVVNAVDSQRTDQDYLFHPRNASYLQETVKNMWQLLFWHVDPQLYNADELVKNANEHIQRAITRGTSEEDLSLLKSAFQHLEIASQDPLWRAMQAHEDIPYRVFNMVESVFHSWTRTPGRESTNDTNESVFLHADRLLKLHDMVVQRPLIREQAMVEWGQAVGIRDEAFRTAYEESLRKGKIRRKTKPNSDGDHPSSGSMLANNFAKKASSADTLKEIQIDLDATLARLSSEDDDGPTADNATISSSAFGRAPSLLASSPLSRVRIGSSASTKLNYIINEVQTFASTEKFLIFSDSPLTLAHIAEALELIHVKFLRFTTQVLPQFREQLVLTFETSETYRVLLMELKHGARGLNLISASRVIFCEPVWQADVESQAIKRAHRIGQLRPITVKTLAIRGTAEERMVARRNALKNSQEKLPKLIEEAGMRHYIANPKFITQTPTLTPTIDFAFIDLPPVSAPRAEESIMLKIPPLSTPPRKRIRLEGPVNEPSSSGPTHSPGKRIRFAD